MKSDLLFDDYKVKLDYVKSQYDRMWRRFDFFLTVELAIFGFLGYVTFDVGVAAATLLAACVGLGISVLWYVVGAQDRAIVEVYRKRAHDAAIRFRKAPEGIVAYEEDHAAAEIGRQWNGLRSWYWPPIRITKLPATVGLVLIGVWLVILLYWPSFAQRIASDRSELTDQVTSSEPR